MLSEVYLWDSSHGYAQILKNPKKDFGREIKCYNISDTTITKGSVATIHQGWQVESSYNSHPLLSQKKLIGMQWVLVILLYEWRRIYFNLLNEVMFSKLKNTSIVFY